jgi:hypothetical protein
MQTLGTSQTDYSHTCAQHKSLEISGRHYDAHPAHLGSGFAQLDVSSLMDIIEFGAKTKLVKLLTKQHYCGEFRFWMFSSF